MSRLHIYDTDNRVTGVLEYADPVTNNGSMDYAGTTGREMAVEYNEWGAMSKDEARRITSDTCDRLGNPSRVSFSSPRGGYASYVYSAIGERLKATHYTSPIFQGGVAEAMIASLGISASKQPFKFGGKELVKDNGLNEYDFGARQYYQAVPGFTSIDKMCEKYYWLSPYLYCANNPINLSDPTGKVIEMPKGTSVTDILTVMWNMMQLTDDKLVFSTQKDGSVRIKIASLGKGKKTVGTQLIRNLNSSDKTVTINISDKSNQERDENKTNASNGKGANTKVFFNQNSNSKTLITNSKTGEQNLSNRPSYIGLAHELIHADHSMQGIAIDYSDGIDFTYRANDGKNHIQQNVPKEELSTIGLVEYHIQHTITENDIRREHGLPLRCAYGIPKK